MKTMTLEEAFAKATKGPLRPATANDYSGIAIETVAKRVVDRQTICQMEFDDTHASYCESNKEAYAGDIHDETKHNAALLAHCFNHFQDAVAQLETAVNVLEDASLVMDKDREENLEDLMPAMKAALSKSKTVKLP